MSQSFSSVKKSKQQTDWGAFLNCQDIVFDHLMEEPAALCKGTVRNQHVLLLQPNQSLYFPVCSPSPFSIFLSSLALFFFYHLPAFPHFLLPFSTTIKWLRMSQLCIPIFFFTVPFSKLRSVKLLFVTTEIFRVGKTHSSEPVLRVQ